MAERMAVLEVPRPVIQSRLRSASRPSLLRSLFIAAALAFVGALASGDLSLPFLEARLPATPLANAAEVLGRGLLAFAAVILVVGWARAGRFRAAPPRRAL